MDHVWALVVDELAQDVDAIGDELGIGCVGVALHLAAVNRSGRIFPQHMFQSYFCWFIHFSATEGNEMELSHGSWITGVWAGDGEPLTAFRWSSEIP